MTAKEILTDLTYYDTVKHLRKDLHEMFVEFVCNDEIDYRQDILATFTVLDNHLKQIGRYQRQKGK
jgi:hypothetical protein